MKRNNNRPHIGILHNFYLQKGGEDQVVENEIRLLRNNNFMVYFLEFRNSSKPLMQISNFVFSFFNFSSFLKCIKWIKCNKIDVLHIHNWFYEASPSVIWAAWLCKVPVIMTLHNFRLICPSGNLVHENAPFMSSLNTVFPWEAVRKGVYRNSIILTFILAFNVWINKKLGTWNLISRFIILTQHTREIIQKSRMIIEPQKFIIKPNFIFKTVKEPVNYREDHFLYVGRLSEDKGLNILLEVFSQSPHELVIIGTGPLQNKVEEFIKKNPNVSYKGFREKEAIENEMLKCSALIFPSISCETFGMVIIEAFALRTPVIASNLGGASIIVKDEYNGLHIEGLGPAAVKDKLDKWASLGAATKEKYYKNAYTSYLQYYSPEKNLEQLIKAYQSVINMNGTQEYLK